MNGVGEDDERCLDVVSCVWRGSRICDEDKKCAVILGKELLADRRFNPVFGDGRDRVRAGVAEREESVEDDAIRPGVAVTETAHTDLMLHLWRPAREHVLDDSSAKSDEILLGDSIDEERIVEFAKRGHADEGWADDSTVPSLPAIPANSTRVAPSLWVESKSGTAHPWRMSSPSTDDSLFTEHESTLAYHLAHPEVSPRAHILAKSQELAKFVNARKTLYLDTKFWIKLRDAALGAPVEPADAILLAELRRAVRDGRMICPVAGDMISELLSIGDQAKRVVAAQLVDELAQGVTLRTEFERQGIEVEDFIRRRGRDPVTTPARDLMWTCPGFAFGLTVPTSPAWDAATNFALQKAFIDHLYTLRYATADRMLGKMPGKLRDRSGLAEKLNCLNQQHAATIRSWPKLLSDEFRGMLDVSLPVIAATLDGVGEEHFNRLASDEDRAASKATAPKFAAILAALFEQDRVADFVPSFVVRAYLAAGVRWDKTRRYHENDFHDFAHAVAALPYFDIFATERSLAHLVTVPLKLDRRYRAQVIKTSGELLAVLAKP